MRRLGHEPVPYDGTSTSDFSVDAAVIEPGEATALDVARMLRARDVPVLFTSIYPADSEVLELGPSAYLVKPFPLYALERALELALGVMAATPAAVAL